MANDAPRPLSLFPPSPISQANASSILSAGASLSKGNKTDSIEDQAMQDIEASDAGEGGRVSVRKEEFEEDNDKTVSIEDVEGADSESGMWTDCEEEDEEEETSTEGGSEDEGSDRSYELVDEQTLEELRTIWDNFDRDQREPFDDFVASAARWSIEAVRRMLEEAEEDQRVAVEDEEFRKDGNNLQSWIGVENGLEGLVALQLKGAKDRLEVERDDDRLKSWKLIPDAGTHYFLFQTSESDEALFDNLRSDVNTCEDCFLMLCIPIDDKDALVNLIAHIAPDPRKKLRKLDIVLGTDLSLDFHAWATVKAVGEMFKEEGVGFFPFYLGNLDFIPIEYKVWYMVINRFTGLVTVGFAVGSGEGGEENPRKGFNSYNLGVKFVYDGRSPISQLYCFLQGMSNTFRRHWTDGELFMPTPTLLEIQQRPCLDEKHYSAVSLLSTLDDRAKEQAILFRDVPKYDLYAYHQRRLNGGLPHRYARYQNQTKTEKAKEEEE